MAGLKWYMYRWVLKYRNGNPVIVSNPAIFSELIDCFYSIETHKDKISNDFVLQFQKMEQVYLRGGEKLESPWEEMDLIEVIQTVLEEKRRVDYATEY